MCVCVYECVRVCVRASVCVCVCVRAHTPPQYRNRTRHFFCLFFNSTGQKNHATVGKTNFFFIFFHYIHQIGHALVEQNSGLIWYQQPGAINEAFADITGEVLEHFIRGHDWLTGADISRGDDAVR